MRKIILLSFLLSFFACTELQQIASQIPTGTAENAKIGNGLKQALELGVLDGVTALSQKDGFFRNQAAKILLPQELQKVDTALRGIGLGKLADEGQKLLNRAAEDAVVEAKPIFLNAIKGMTIADAKNILLGGNNAATNFLQERTNQQLYAAFQPKIQSSLDKVGANKIWENIIGKYNGLTSNSVNPDLTAYVTQQALNGLFKQVAQKEEGIRTKASLRTTSLLQEVFALQDKPKG